MKKNITMILLTIFLFACISVKIAQVFAVAEDEVGYAGDQQEQMQEAPLVRPEISVSRADVPGKITFSFKDADIRNVMRLIATKAGVNIVYGPEVAGVVNMELRDVPWEQALGLVLDLNGYAYQKKGNVIKVLRKEDVDKEPLSTEVFILNYSRAEEMVESVQQILSERGSIKTDTRSNTVVVTDIPANINKIELVLNQLDGRTTQVLIETKIVEMRNTLEKDLGLKWTSLKEYSLSVGDMSRTYKSTRRGGHGAWDSGTANIGTDGNVNKNFFEDEDITTRDFDFDNITGTTANDTTMIDLSDTVTRTITDTVTSTLLKGDIRTAILSAADFEIILSALQENTDVNLLSNPRVVTANNEEAEIKIISEYPVPNYEFDTETSQWSITGFDKEDIGVIFNVTPNISSDGYITMKLEPEVSTLIDLVPFTAGGSTVLIPYVGRKKASSKLVIKSGDTLVVGGLIDEDKVTVVTKVPLLGDIPVLGRLFRHTDIDNIKKDIIFFITATIIDEETKGLIMDSEPVPVETTTADYKKVFKDSTKQDKDLASGNKGYISTKTSN